MSLWPTDEFPGHWPAVVLRYMAGESSSTKVEGQYQIRFDNEYVDNMVPASSLRAHTVSSASAAAADAAALFAAVSLEDKGGVELANSVRDWRGSLANGISHWCRRVANAGYILANGAHIMVDASKLECVVKKQMPMLVEDVENMAEIFATMDSMSALDFLEGELKIDGRRQGRGTWNGTDEQKVAMLAKYLDRQENEDALGQMDLGNLLPEDLSSTKPSSDTQSLRLRLTAEIDGVNAATDCIENLVEMLRGLRR
jgi:hypothetical protein